MEQLLGENSGIRIVLALTSSSADPVKSSGFLQVGGVEFKEVMGSNPIGICIWQMQMSQTMTLAS